MSDTPPDRKEPDDAPAAPRNPWVGWLVWAVLAPVLYVLSIGPAAWLSKRSPLPEFVVSIYSPLKHLPDYLLDPIKRYIEWWVS
jgi:hypothetical protein